VPGSKKDVKRNLEKELQLLESKLHQKSFEGLEDRVRNFERRIKSLDEYLGEEEAAGMRLKLNELKNGLNLN
jgi:hypothetical protein